jgi:hypothetical protein
VHREHGEKLAASRALHCSRSIVVHSRKVFEEQTRRNGTLLPLVVTTYPPSSPPQRSTCTALVVAAAPPPLPPGQGPPLARPAPPVSGTPPAPTYATWGGGGPINTAHHTALMGAEADRR